MAGYRWRDMYIVKGRVFIGIVKYWLLIDEFTSILKKEYTNFISLYLVITLLFMVLELFKGWIIYQKDISI